MKEMSAAEGLQDSDRLPIVSVLIAARNEEHYLPQCIEALLRLDYPIERLDILIGNDGSTDGTGAIAEAYAAAWPHIRVIHVSDCIGHARGKANVLEHLARAARGTLWLMTDADILVGPGWIQGMLAAFEAPGTGIVTGWTQVQAIGWLGRMQAIDWTNALVLLASLSALGLPQTSMGNNMGIRREAYTDTGGYAKIPFSVTEDFALFRAVRAAGWGSTHRLTKEVRVLTWPIPDAEGLLRQRLRWMQGAMATAWPVKTALVLLAFFPVWSLALTAWSWEAFGLAWCAKLLAETAWGCWSLLRTGQARLMGYLPVYACYVQVLLLVLVLRYLSRKGQTIEWKGRHYPAAGAHHTKP